MARQGKRGLTNGHQAPSNHLTAESISSSVETVCSICEMPYHQDHEQEFTFCCDRPIGSRCYQAVLDEGIECPYCGQMVQPMAAKPRYILRFGHRVAAAEKSVTPETPASSEDESGSPCTKAEELPDERACTRVQVFLLDSFQRFLEDVRVFDEDALTEEQKLAMVKTLEMQLGLRV